LCRYEVGGKIRRYTSPDEHAFYPGSLPLLVIGAMSYPNPLAPAADTININDRIMDMYINNLVGLSRLSSTGVVVVTPGCLFGYILASSFGF
jgi:hypothetical protein